MAKVNTKKRKPVTPPAQPEPKKSADRLTKERIEQLQIAVSELQKANENLIQKLNEHRAGFTNEVARLSQKFERIALEKQMTPTNSVKNHYSRGEAQSEIFSLLSFRTTLSTASKVKVLSDLMKVFVSDDDGNRKIKENDLRASFDRLKKEEAVTETIKEIFDL